MKYGEEDANLVGPPYKTPRRLRKSADVKSGSRRQLSGLGEQAAKTGLLAARMRVWQSSLTPSPVMTERSKNCPAACSLITVLNIWTFKIRICI